MYKRLDNVTKNNRHQSIITSIQFHPHKNILFTVGLDKTLKLFEVDQKSTKVDSVFFEDMPIYKAGFINDDEILLVGNKKHFYTYDI